MRRGLMRIVPVISIVALTLTLGFVHPAGADDATAGHAVIGSWQLLAGDAMGAPTGDPTLATFTSDGTLILTGRPVRPALPFNPFKYAFFSTGHGQWAPKDDHSIDFTVVHVRSDETGIYRGTTIVSGTLTIGDDGQTVAGDETFTVVDPDGTIVTAFPFALTGKRISVEPMADMGTPTAARGCPHCRLLTS